MLNFLKQLVAAKIQSLTVTPIAVPAKQEVVPTIVKEDNNMSAYPITDVQKFTLAVGALSAAGNTTGVTALATTTSDATVVTATVQADGVSVEVAAAGKLGAATITLTSGTATSTFDVLVNASAAASLVLTPSAPVAK